MTDAGFFKGTSAEQDTRFADKKKKLMKTMKFGDNLSQKVDMTRIKLDCIRPWVINRITELLNFEDEVVCNYVLNQLEERHPDPREIQINITGFLNSKNARIFLTELWDLLLSAMDNADGIPSALLEAKKAEITKRQEDEHRIQLELRKKEEELRQKESMTEAFRGIGVRTIHNASAPQSQRDTQQNGGDINNETTEKISKTRSSRRSRSSSSVSPRTQRRRSPKKLGSSKHSRHGESRHRRRRRSPSSSSSSDSKEKAKMIHREPRRNPRSKSPEEKEPTPPKKPVPDSDWRKDLMAGRRRSPPEMPENSYYGFDKRNKERKHSRDRHRDSRRRHAEIELRHSLPYEHTADVERRRRDYHSSSHRDSYPIDDRHRRDKHRHRESRSPISRRELEESSIADRANKFHNRRAQWAQEDDEVVQPAKGAPKEKRRESAVVIPQPSEPSRKRPRSPSPEGPILPPSQLTPKKATVIKEETSSSSESESEDSSSSSDEASSSSSESVESEPNPKNDINLKMIKKTHVTPPPIVPEGPALPPSLSAPPEWTETKSLDHSASSSSSGSESSADNESSQSSASESDSESSCSEGEAEPKRLTQELGRSTTDKIPTTKPSSNRKAAPVSQNISSKHPSSKMVRKPSPRSHTKVSELKGKHGERSEDSAEEALRKRALASLIRASGDRRSAKSRSP